MMVIPGTPTVPPPPPPLPNVPPPPPPLVNHLMPPRFEQVQHSNNELASKFSDLKYRVDQLALRVMVRYPWWSLIIGVSSIWIPLFFRSKDRIDALWVIVGYALLVCLGRFAKKGWEAELDDKFLGLCRSAMAVVFRLPSALGIYDFRVCRGWITTWLRV